MKQINIWFDDPEYDKIRVLKDASGSGWHDFIIDLVEFKSKGGNQNDANTKNP
jgi:hypothetical protein